MTLPAPYIPLNPYPYRESKALRFFPDRLTKIFNDLSVRAELDKRAVQDRSNFLPSDPQPSGDFQARVGVCAGTGTTQGPQLKPKVIELNTSLSCLVLTALRP